MKKDVEKWLRTHIWMLLMLTLTLVVSGVVASSVAHSQSIDDGITRLYLPLIQGGDNQGVNAAIVGGHDVALTQTYPWMVALQVTAPINGVVAGFGGQFCGGVLIAPQWVLTAKHCFSDPTITEIQFRLVIGARDLADLSTADVVVPSVPGIFPQSDTDLVLVRLIRPSSKTHANLANSAFNPTTFTGQAQSIGWGNLGNNKFPSVLQQLDNMPMYDTAQCNSQWTLNIPSYELCAGFVNLNKGVCFGDSGGPLFSGNTIIGTLSRVIPPCVLPATFTKVYSSATLEWINRTMLDNSPPAPVCTPGPTSVPACIPETSTPPGSCVPGSVQASSADTTCPTPTPSLPTPIATPSGGSVGGTGNTYTVSPGQKFQPIVTVSVGSGSFLVSRGDHLHAVPESGDNTLGAWPVQAVKTNVSAGGSYVFNNPSFQMTAPLTPGTYRSNWQMRIGGVHVGPVITIVVNVVAAPSTPVPAGWQAQWYSNRDLNSRCGNIEYIPDMMFFLNWAGGAPSGCPTDNWSAKLIRDINFSGGDYLFHCHSDDGCIVLVEGVKVIDCWWDKSYSACEGGKNLSGTKRVEIQYYDKTSDARLSFWLMGPGFLPMRDTCDPSQWCGSYYPGNQKLEPEDSPTIRKNEGTGTLKKEFWYGSPGFGINPDYFSAKWERTVYFKAGQYRFFLDHDDGGIVQIDGAYTGPNNFNTCCVVDTKDVWLTEGNHTLKVSYQEGTNQAYLRMWWETLQQCYSLTTTVNPASSGTVNVSPASNCPVDATRYLGGTNVTMTLNPATGYVAQGVSGDVYALGNTASVIMTWDRSVAAYFVPSVTNTPTATPSPTNTPVLPTPTATSTPVPPTATTTNTPVPPTATSTTTSTPSPTATMTATSLSAATRTPTATVTNTPGPMPAAPSNLGAIALDSTRIQLNWKDNSSNEAGFKVYEGSTLLATIGPNLVSYIVTGLAPSSYHCYALYAYNSYGSAGTSGSSCASTLSGISKNFALGRPAYATSQESAAFAPAKGNDGNTGTSWSSQSSATARDEWWITDLGTQTFDRVIVRWGAAYSTQYFIGWSNDGVNFTGYWYTVNSAGNYLHTLGSRTARYAGILMRQRAPCCGNYSFSEYEAYGTVALASAQAENSEANSVALSSEGEEVTIQVTANIGQNTLFIPLIQR